MIVGYIIAAGAGGMISGLVALLLDASSWTALLYYVGGGMTAVCLLAGAALARAPQAAYRASRQGEILPSDGREYRAMRRLAVGADGFGGDLAPVIGASGHTEMSTAMSWGAARDLPASGPDADVLVVEINLPKMDSVVLRQQVRAMDTCVTTQIVMPASQPDPRNMVETSRTGVSGKPSGQAVQAYRNALSLPNSAGSAG
ncbi:hypothetical protein [Leisingera sp.]|uniref:hypothetical protein n=1 Tax=Leisingera sp. TaxID=1879318 RepID=UPI002B271FA6|nr:hypothetical protein [Leisingera sp.]